MDIPGMSGFWTDVGIPVGTPNSTEIQARPAFAVVSVP